VARGILTEGYLKQIAEVERVPATRSGALETGVWGMVVAELGSRGGLEQGSRRRRVGVEAGTGARSQEMLAA
jgi:hypothetical protein